MRLTTASCLTVTVAIAAVLATAAPAKQSPFAPRDAESFQDKLEDSIEHHVNSAQHYAHKAQHNYQPSVASHVKSAQGYLNTEVHSAQKHHLARSAIATPAGVEHRISVEDRKVHSQQQHRPTAAPSRMGSADKGKHSGSVAQGNKDVPGRKNGNLIQYGFHEAHSGTRQAGNAVSSVDKMLYGPFDRRHEHHEHKSTVSKSLTATVTAKAGATAHRGGTTAAAASATVTAASHSGNVSAANESATAAASASAHAHALMQSQVYPGPHESTPLHGRKDDADAEALGENGWDYGAMMASSDKSQATAVVDSIDSTLYGFTIADPTAAFPVSSGKSHNHGNEHGKVGATATAQAKAGKVPGAKATAAATANAGAGY